VTTIEVAAFADLGVECYHQGTLVDGLELLAARLDYAGAGELLRELMGLEFTDSDKRDPKPVPTPKPPPKPQPKGWRS
jgi:hypothetical protein